MFYYCENIGLFLQMIDEIRCERTKRLIETSEYREMDWSEILLIRDREVLLVEYQTNTSSRWTMMPLI